MTYCADRRRQDMTSRIERLCQGACHPYWPALRSKVDEILAKYTGPKPGVLVKSSLIFESGDFSPIQATNRNLESVNYWVSSSTSTHHLT